MLVLPYESSFIYKLVDKKLSYSSLGGQIYAQGVANIGQDVTLGGCRLGTYHIRMILVAEHMDDVRFIYAINRELLDLEFFFNE